MADAAGLGREDTGDENVEAFATRLMAKAMVGLDCRGTQPHTGAGDANHSPQRRMAFAAATPTRHSVVRERGLALRVCLGRAGACRGVQGWVSVHL